MKPVILIADDDDAVRTTLGRILESENYNVVFARNGMQALSEFLIMPYDLLLLDLNMPGRDGWEVFDALSRLHPMMPIIIITALPGQQQRALRAGADALLEKPLDLSLLLQTVRETLAKPVPVRMARKPKPAATTAPLAPGNAGAGERKINKTILLADDDDSIRYTLGRVLQSEHYDVLLARTGHEAVVQFLHYGPPDLVLLDLNMPDKDGWEAFELMKQFDRLAPVIVITARPHQYEKAVGLGVDALMEKPLDLPVLLETMKKLLAHSEQARIERPAKPAFTTEFLPHRTRELPRRSAS